MNFRNAIFNGGTFVHTASPTSKGFETLYGKIATDAFHDSGERFDPPKCHPNTRVAVLEEIMRWIRAIENSEDVLWLYGSAGAGKSAIAQTVAEKCAELGLIVASFFFSRASESRNNDKCLISSIAYQLAISIPATRSHIELAVQSDLAIFDRSLETQIKTLIIQPLKNACADLNPNDAKQWPKIMIIDGLDECRGPSIQCSIIRLLSAALRCVPVSLILLIASRPEPHIRNTFSLLAKSKHQAFRPIVLDDSYKPDADIKEFLLSRFKEINENHPLAVYIPEYWPHEEIIDQLVRKSSGQFVYASTVMKYLDSPRHRPTRRLDVIMGLLPFVGDIPFKELDALYSHIFACVEDLVITLNILKFLFFGYRRYSSPFTSPGYLAHLLRLDEEDIHLHLSELHSILYIPPPSSQLEIRPIHASLQDFLVDKLRSGKYYLDEEAFHTNLAQKCARHLRAWSRNPGYRSMEWYLACSFIHHCTRASTDSTELRNDLMQLCNLRPWLDFVPMSDRAELPSLFKWLYKADTAAKELSSHIQLLLGQYITAKRREHTFDWRTADIAELVSAMWISPMDRFIAVIHQQNGPLPLTDVNI